MRGLTHDLRDALRLLVRAPGFSLTAVLVLTAGIGANTAVFTIANALLFRPAAAGGLLGLYSQDRERPDRYRAFSYPDYADIRDGCDAFSSVLAHALTLVGVTEGDMTRRAFADVVSSNFFETLGARLAAGRVFTLDEERPGSGRRVAIVSHAFWRRRGGRPDMLGGRIRLNGDDYTVVGITARGFTGASVLISPEVYLPLGVLDLVSRGGTPDDAAHTRLADRETYALFLAGRLRPGVSADQAGPALDTLARHLSEASPAPGRGFTVVLHRLSRIGVGTRPYDDGAFVALAGLFQAMAGVVLLVACLNLANLLLARAGARRREVGVRLALGAGRGRIVRQLLVEGLVLSLAGAAGGLAVASGAVRLLVSAFTSSLIASPLTGSLPLAIDMDVGPDPRVLAATLGLAVASTCVFGLWPAVRLTRPDVVSELKRQASDPAGGRRTWRSAGNVLVVSQVALSLALLTAGGLFLQSAVDAASVDPGFAFENGLVAGLDPGLAGYGESRGREALGRVLERVRALPATRAASLASVVVYGEMTEEARVSRPEPAAGARPATVVSNVVSADYFASLGLKMLRGREFTSAEESSAAGPPVAIIDEPLARRLFPDEEALGGHVVPVDLDGSPVGPALEIVGIAPGLRQDLFDRAPVAHLYRPTGRLYRAGTTLHVKLRGGGRDAAAAVASVRQAIREADDRLAILYLEPLESYRATNFYLWLARLGAKLFGLFAALAVALALLGLYGVKAYLVARRTREFGIRVALGAAPRDVVWLVMRDGAALAGAGVVLGLGLAVVVARLVGSLVYRSSPFDPVVFATAAALLFSAAMLATWIPARRATRVEPTVALRTE